MTSDFLSVFREAWRLSQGSLFFFVLSVQKKQKMIVFKVEVERTARCRSCDSKVNIPPFIHAFDSLTVSMRGRKCSGDLSRLRTNLFSLLSCECSFKTVSLPGGRRTRDTRTLKERQGRGIRHPIHMLKLSQPFSLSLSSDAFA